MYLTLYDSPKAITTSPWYKESLEVRLSPVSPLMKLLIAIIQPTKLQAVREALYRIGVERMTVCDSQGYGRQRGQTATYRGIEYKVNMLRKVALEIMVNDDFVERTVDTLLKVARTGSEGNIGDGKIFILPAEETISIDSELRGPGAV